MAIGTRTKNIYSNIDWITIIIYLLLIFLGWINVYSVVYDSSKPGVSIFDFSQRYGKQLLWIMISLFSIIVILLIDSKFYSSFAYILYAFAILLLIIVLFFGKEVKAAQAWIEIGGFRMQPVEFAKITVCLALARYLSNENFSFQKIKDVAIALLIMLLPVMFIFLQNDTGSALVFFSLIFVLYRQGLNTAIFITIFASIALFILALISNIEILLIIIYIITVLGYVFSNINNIRNQIVLYLFLFFTIISIIIYYYTDVFQDSLQIVILINIALMSVSWLILLFIKKEKNLFLSMCLLVGIVVFTLSVDYLFNNVLQVHQQNRINELLGKNSDPLGVGYNVNQSKIAIGSGGLIGKGFLKGTQTKFNFVPEQSTDFIFCTIGEEWGLVGTTFIIILFVILIIRIILLAERQRSLFSKLYGYGVASIFFFHIAINIAMTVGLAPVIGIPLPFFSYGGSSLWAFTILLFIFIKLDSDRLQVFR